MAKLIYKAAYGFYQCTGCLKPFPKVMVETMFGVNQYQPRLDYCPHCGAWFDHRGFLDKTCKKANGIQNE